MAKLNAKQIPIDYMPTTGEVDKYLHQWDDLENYVNQEKALDKLFFQLCKTNVDPKIRKQSQWQSQLQ